MDFSYTPRLEELKARAAALAQLDEAHARRPVPPLFDGTVRNLL
jgi:hypothetical protein